MGILSLNSGPVEVKKPLRARLRNLPVTVRTSLVHREWVRDPKKLEKVTGFEIFPMYQKNF